jgi:Asp-tRNA(Asn)/Glu-tRNA(Gln) amidotransferase B subunit
MYPDTDTPPLPIHDSMVEEVRAQMGETPWVRQVRYEALGLDSRSARVLSTAPWADLFDQLDPQEGEVACRLATVLETRIPYHARRSRGAKPRSFREVPDAALIAPLIRAMERDELRPEALIWAVDEVLGPAGASPRDALSRFRPRTGDDESLDDLVDRVGAMAGTMDGRSPNTLLRWGMGEVMRNMRGRVDPEEVRSRLERILDSRLETEEGKGSE